MKKVEVLCQLQGVDTTLDRARERLATVLRRLDDRSTLDEVTAQHAAAASELQNLTADQNDFELQVQDLRGKLTELEKKLYSGTVANPKELDAMTRDAQQYRQLISTREDRLIEIYDLVESATSRLAEATERLETATTTHSQERQALGVERNDLESTIAEQENQRQRLAGEADAQSVRIYEGLRRTRGGLAVAEVAQRTCQGCRVTLPASEETRARSSQDLVLCQSCGRILHAGL